MWMHLTPLPIKNKKIVTLEQFKPLRKKFKEEGKKVVFTNGCFDLLHYGHVKYLFEASKLGDILIVGLNSDNSVKKLKGEDRPIFNEIDRAEILSELFFVDYVIIFEEETPYNLIKEIVPDMLVKGGDYNIDEIVGRDVVEREGGIVVTIPFVEGISTSAIINKIKSSK